MMMKIMRTISTFTLLFLMFASPTLANDPLTIKLDNMKNGITRLIGAVEEQRTQLEMLKNDVANSGPDQGTLDTISVLDREIEELKDSILQQLAAIDQNAAQIKDQIDALAIENSKVKSEQLQLIERVAKIEDIFRMEKQVDAIVKREDGSAELFRLNTVTEFKSVLPDGSLCREYAEVLQNFPARDLNAFFVVGTSNDIQLCKLEYGLTQWQVVPASIADRGHVIKKY